MPLPAYESAFLGAFEEYSDALFRHACFRISDRERAVDLTQETFVKVWDYVREGNEVRQWRGFLYRILNNLIVDEYRRKKEQSLDTLLEENPVHANVYIGTDSRAEREERFDDEFLITKIRSLIPKLPEPQRVAVTLRYIDGLGPKEIAVSLGISENAVSVRIHRGVEHLKKLCGTLTTP